ncbi:unnamed protein product, partial [Rotaria sp. Silwood2]
PERQGSDPSQTVLEMQGGYKGGAMTMIQIDGHLWTSL